MSQRYDSGYTPSHRQQVQPPAEPTTPPVFVAPDAEGAGTQSAESTPDRSADAREEAGRGFSVASVEPLDVDGVRTMTVGTVLWIVALVALLPFVGTLSESGQIWWLWTCLAGFGLGLIGIEYCRRRRNVVDRDTRALPSHAGPPRS